MRGLIGKILDNMMGYVKLNLILHKITTDHRGTCLFVFVISHVPGLSPGGEGGLV